MIYETIPAHYFDHTDLLKAIIASKVLSENANHWAYLATEELMEKDLTSGQAFEAGNMINILKNVECAVDYWKKIFTNVAKKSFGQNFCCVDDDHYKELEDFRDEYERSMGTELDNGSLMIPDVFHDFYDEWREQIVLPVARKYNIEVYSSQQEQDFRKCGIAEKEDYSSATRII